MPGDPPPDPSAFTWRDALCAGTILLAAFLLFWRSPIVTVGDSKYALLVTQNLLSKGSFVLDDYSESHRQPGASHESYLNPAAYQLETVDGHLYDYFPPGTAILSAPFVLVGNALGHPVVRPDGTYSLGRESGVQHCIASVLMAVLAVIFYGTARLLLPPGWSVCLALGGALGTQVWSTASRALWTHTWGISLLGFALWLLLAHETGRLRFRPILLATVLSWTYFVRPTNSIFIVGFTVYLALFHRRQFLAYAAAGAAWFAGFVVYSWVHFHHALPAYYQGSRLETTHFHEALAGNLISPSRGLLIFVPVTLFVFYLVARFWRTQPFPRLVGLTVPVSILHLVAVSCFVPWFGGWCYGPRYTTELVPWFVLLAVLGLTAARRWRAEEPAVRSRVVEWRGTLAAGMVLLLLSVAINARGASVYATWRWNERPVTVDQEPWRVWDWRDPQILAGILDDPLPPVFPPLEGHRLSFGGDTGARFLWQGWSNSESTFCWSEARRATVIFAFDDLSADHLTLAFHVFLYGRKLPRQKVKITLNGQRLASLIVRDNDPHDYTFALPPGVLGHRNVLTFDLPDAVSPGALSRGWKTDPRLLGVALRSLELETGIPTPSPAPIPP